ncbi:SGNH/GDSL hydrolase family protein [Mucilaginibacter glaciei]|uniref:SGNH/GDSL hydrolase family protein n=1 Tax=Mucilaginibacter glaciei TaxID=2772109 RepID=A0A926NTZ1_9SPHI|nr:SGNH/GDSL hydrolase family protein [Mucilaginibacter glaciei]MBD1395223.1 SGNH/GDSL hydrolase family protein [Mucilaginibacter glaciei]
MKNLLTILTVLLMFNARAKDMPVLYKADNPNFKYVGRVDFANPQLPKFWSPGVYIVASFKGTSCELLINDEELYGKTHNYIEVVIDGKASRIQTTGKTNAITIANNLPDAKHTVLICKDTESGMGYLQFVGLKCAQLLPPAPLPKRKIEYIGDSITAAQGIDESVIPCGKGQWYDQHNAYEGYAARTSRALNAQWQVTAVAGIGLIHSCCNMDILMPQVYDKTSLRQDSVPYNFNYQPDVVTICLGQNDGKQDSTSFCSAYVKLISTIRSKYPQADVVCLTSPMADASLTKTLKSYLTGIVQAANAAGYKNVSKYFFSRSYNSGCSSHPDMKEHALIAQELTGYIRQLKHW